MTQRPLRVLVIEDNPADFHLIELCLAKGGVKAHCRRVTQLADLKSALASEPWDVVLSDYSVPRLDFQDTLAFLRQHDKAIPLILVSGSVGEELAVELLRLGVWDFVLKDSLLRLVPAIERSLRDAAERRDRRIAEAAVLISESRYRRLFESSRDGLLIVDAASGRIEDVNPYLAQLLAVSRPEVVGVGVRDLPAFRRLFPDEDSWPEAAGLETGLRREQVLVDGRGRRLDLELFFSRFQIDDRLLIQCSVRDITERKSHEREIERISRLYATLSQITKAAVRVRDRGELFDEVCRITAEVGGFERTWVGHWDTTTGRVVPLAQRGDREGILQRIRITADDTPEGRGPVGTSIREGRPCVCNNIEALPESTPWRALALGQGLHSLAAVPVEFAGAVWGAFTVYDGEIDAFEEQEVVLLTEVARAISHAMEYLETESRRQLAEAALRESEERYRLLAENAEDFVVLTRVDGTTLYVSPSFYRVTGWSPAEFAALGIADIIHQEDLPSVQQALGANLAGQASQVEYRLRCRDGSWIWMDTRGKPVIGVDGQVRQLQLWSRDLTQRKRSEQEHQRLVTAIEQAAEVVVITDCSGAIVYVNPAFEKSTGYTREEALGVNPRILKSGKHEPEFYRRMWQVLAGGGVWSGRLVNRRKDGTHYEEEATISPVRDASGRIVNFVAVKRDVTREVQLEAQFRQVQKTEAIGQLAGGVAHDFNNILATILMQTELELGDPKLTSQSRESLQEIRQAAERGASLTRQLLLFSRRQVMQPKTLDLGDVVKHLAKMLQRILGEDIRLQLQLHPAPLWVHADSGMLDQVLVNLAVNARDAMATGGRLTIETAEMVLAPDQESPHPDAVPGRYAILRVSDTGSGIAQEHLPRIFDPFFTTKEVGHGTGLGLATVQGIVKQHRGWIEVVSAPGQGAMFQLHFPVTDIPATAPRGMADLPPARPASETILLVEDESSLRAVTAAVLRRQGYRVLEAAHGPEALAIAREPGTHLDLLLTDVVLPEGLGGRELAAQLAEERPGLKILFMSGYIPELAGRRWALQPGQHFLQKPATSAVLIQTVRECLGG